MSQQALGFIEAIVIDVSDLDRSTAFWTAITGQTFGPSFEPNFRRPGSSMVRPWFYRKFGK